MITFSFNPSSLSIFPSTAAFARTFVVSWNDDAEIKLSVFTAALVIPCITGSYVAGVFPF